MSVLIVFSSIEGQTKKIAEFAKELIETRGIEVKLVNIATAAGQIGLKDASSIILAAPVHERRFPKDFEVFIAARRADLATRWTLMLSVSLAAAFQEKIDDARDFQTEMEMRTHFSPDEVELVAGAVRPTSYGYFESQILRHVILHDRPIDPTTEREFTDWERLKERIESFLAEQPLEGPKNQD